MGFGQQGKAMDDQFVNITDVKCFHDESIMLP
jgi:hypothetical protein